MNLKKLYDRVVKEWPKLGFTLDSYDGNKIKISADIVAEKYFDDTVYCQITAYKSGTMHVMLTFDLLECTLENYDLINEFNRSLSWFKAYIIEVNSGNHYFELHYASVCEANDKAMAHTIDFLLTELLDDDTMKYLKPILERTVATSQKAHTPSKS